MRTLRLFGFAAGLVLPACDTPEPSACPPGALACACTGGGGCDPGLECDEAGTCVEPLPQDADGEDADDEGDGYGDGDGGSEGGDNPPSTCDATAVQDAVLALCEAQADAEYSPGDGQTGSPCSSGTQCSGVCLDDAPYDGFGECAARCSADSECPFGYSCSPNGDEMLCRESWCTVPTAVDACISDFLGRHADACEADCGGPFVAWFDCLSEAGPICFENDAAECNAAKGLLDHCCGDGAWC